ncbi:MAG: GFA family protein [Proteobacteria bacterium]|nr:GFA family protein [Pseudomonadota bacterium]
MKSDVSKKTSAAKPRAPGPTRAGGECLCGAVAFEIGVPARWTWHDHSSAARRAHGAAYATYVGTWASRFRFLRGEDNLTRYEDPERGGTRSFCSTCGTPVLFQRNKQNVNVPRALFSTGVGREARYHIGIDQLQEWTYQGERLSPLKGFPGVVWNRKRKSAP